MIATSNEACERLRHARTGELQATKNIDRNTKLVYYADELVALRFHQTDIALYLPEGVRLDTRENDVSPSPFGEGWFTLTTWGRIDSHTPAWTQTTNGLRYVRDRVTNESHLYVPGMVVRPDGSLDPDTILQPELGVRIANAKGGFARKADRFAGKVVEAWANWQKVLPCCVATRLSSDTGVAHYLDHFDANEYAVPADMEEWADNVRNNHRAHGTVLKQILRERMREELAPLLKLTIKTLAPEFPFPQLPRRRRGPNGNLTYA